MGKCINLLYKTKKIFYACTREFDNVLAICLSALRLALMTVVTRCHVQGQNAPNSISPGASHQTPLGELTALPQTPSWI